MALADYFGRNALAVAQIANGFDEELLRDRLQASTVGISVGDEARRPEGRALLDLTVRMLARLYPSLSLRAAAGAGGLTDELIDLARAINPALTIGDGAVAVGIAVGDAAPPLAARTFHAGSCGWDALLSTTAPCAVGESDNPFGAGAAACFVSANVFRAVVLGATPDRFDQTLLFSTLERAVRHSGTHVSLRQTSLNEEIVLVGLGAVGNAATWALSRAPFAGRLHLVDHETIELSNLQRYVLAARADEGRSKVDLAQSFFSGPLTISPEQRTWAEFVEQRGYRWPRVLAAVDSARDRRAIQASLPGWIANAWTQPGDLGLSLHPFLGAGACLSCLYLPQAALTNEDEIIATALGVPDRVREIRELLYWGAPAPEDLLVAAAEALQVPTDKLLAFAGRPVRALYSEGVCGGAVVPLSRAGGAPRDVHVPLAHQSALAGVLLAAAASAAVYGHVPASTTVTRIDLMRPLAGHPTQPALKDSRGICICQDADYQNAYRRKYPPSASV